MATAAPPPPPARASPPIPKAFELPLYKSGEVPGALEYRAQNLANQLAFKDKQNGKSGSNMGDPSKRGGRTRRRFKKKRLMSHKYCKKTPCRHMGFTQKASCRPYKNCYTRRK